MHAMIRSSRDTVHSEYNIQALEVTDASKCWPLNGQLESVIPYLIIITALSGCGYLRYNCTVVGLHANATMHFLICIFLIGSDGVVVEHNPIWCRLLRLGECLLALECNAWSTLSSQRGGVFHCGRPAVGR